jgi:Domain of unknown function (DUF1905)
MSSVACESLSVMLREFDARLQKGDNPGAWTCVVMDDAAELFGTRGLVKIRGAIDGEPFDGALMAQGDGTHRLPVKAKLRKAIGKEAGATVAAARPRATTHEPVARSQPCAAALPLRGTSASAGARRKRKRRGDAVGAATSASRSADCEGRLRTPRLITVPARLVI